jgi:hypothetical protein
LKISLSLREQKLLSFPNKKDNWMEKDVFRIKKKNAYLAIAFAIFFIAGFLVHSLIAPTSNIGINPQGSIVQTVSAKEIYPEFICGCCGKTIDKCACGMVAGIKSYIDGLVDGGLPKDEVILKAAQKYGISSLRYPHMQAEIREEIIRRAPADRPRIVVIPESHDFGDVSPSEVISTTFLVKNEGQTDLIIKEIHTSCGCTLASLGGSPFFGMKGRKPGGSPPDWRYRIPPGETVTLEVRYDPDFHKGFRGPATRIVYISSNDPVDFEKKIKIELNQVD